MEGVSTFPESIIVADLSRDPDPNTIVEAVYDNENLPDDELHLPYNFQTNSPSKSHETKMFYPYKCPLCERGFKNVGHLKCHYLKSHRETTPFFLLFDSSLMCKICDKNFSFKSELDNHIKSHIKKNETKPIVQLHQCDICDKKFPLKSALVNHYYSHNNDSLDVKKPNKNYLKHSEDEPNSCKKCFNKIQCDCIHKVFSCPICEASFDTKEELQSHSSIHTTKRFKNDICSADFSSKETRKRLGVHSNEKSFVCEVCKKSFQRKSNLKRHCITHTKERPYQCKVCDSSFSRKNTLETHERTVHSNEKPYECQECNKTFNQKSGLYAHYIAHTKEKPFQCNECKKKFSLRSRLKTHQLIHKKKH